MRVSSGSTITGHIHRFGSSAYFWVILIFVLVIVKGLIYSWRTWKSQALNRQLEDHLPNIDKKAMQDPAFYAYLGHNAITESPPLGPGIIVFEAADHILTRGYLNELILDHTTKEPLSDSHESSPYSPVQGRWRRFSYDDTDNQQLRYDARRREHDTQTGRRWQRRTMHACGI